MVVVSGPRIETHKMSAEVQKTIKTIKEVVGTNHSDADVYVTLKESNMDPNESVQKLLHQDTFHVVKRRRDKKKENIVYTDSILPRMNMENMDQGMRPHTTADRSGSRGGYTRNSYTGSGRSREFRVVRDNRVNQNGYKEIKPALHQCSTSGNEPVVSNRSEKISPETSTSKRPLGGRTLPHGPNIRSAVDTNSNTTLRGNTARPNDFQRHNARPASSGSVVGVYSSSSDPVHVPSLDPRLPAAVGAIRREVGVVGVRKQSSESVKKNSTAGTSISNSVLGKDNSSSAESNQHTSISKGTQQSQTKASASVMPSAPVSRSFSSHKYGSRSHHKTGGHQKAFQPTKEWKPKSIKKPSVSNPGVIESSAKSDFTVTDNSVEFKTEEVKVLQDKLSQVDIFEHQNVVIAQHIRVAETDRCQLTFGSLGTGFQAVSSGSLMVPAPESSLDDNLENQQADKDGIVASSGSHSPESDASAEQQFAVKNESLNSHIYADIGLVRENSQFYVPSESQQQQETTELPSFSTYDPQTGYDMPYFRPTMEESLRGQGLPSPQEVFSSYAANSIPPSANTMVQQQQQQQPPIPQMYPQQVHVSHFANLMPYRQFVSPVYVPPMAMPGYSNNHTYPPHPSNGNSYVLMPGSNSHPHANNLKYGIQQFKPLTAGSPTGFGNFTSPIGYPMNMNTPGVVGSAAGLEDPSRLKFKDGNLYLSNPQAEQSEIWIPNTREHLGMQSAPYYNMSGQSPHGAYMPSHSGHGSFSPAPQSSHMQYPGMYHPQQQPGAVPNHLAPAMGGNVGVGPPGGPLGPQVGVYQQQQPQMSHMNWIPSS